jgi:hypothetical protein
MTNSRRHRTVRKKSRNSVGVLLLLASSAADRDTTGSLISKPKQEERDFHVHGRNVVKMRQRAQQGERQMRRRPSRHMFRRSLREKSKEPTGDDDQVDYSWDCRCCTQDSCPKLMAVFRAFYWFLVKCLACIPFAVALKCYFRKRPVGVTVPAHVYPGNRFDAVVLGQNITVVCPEDASPGDTLRVSFGPTHQPNAAVATASI